ncbi:hypothetical protein [Parafilimonas sp.]|uniref:hypothetical protein n=1 Tax=Parafilimonas sp. TaxID=1969739 RepID=UPI0039E6A3A8
MSWTPISKNEAISWNEKLKNVTAVFNQFPYYTSNEYNSFLSGTRFIKYVANGQDIAYAAIIEIGISPLKIGIIEGGPVLLATGIDMQPLISSLKNFSVKQGYTYLQIRPADNSPVINMLQTDKDFEEKVYFPYHVKDKANLNIYNKPEKELLAGFKMQCRRKMVLSERVGFIYKKADENALNDIRLLFSEVTDNKGYGFRPFKIYEAIYKEGKKYNLCDWYTAYLNNKLVNAVFVVKDGQSYYHYTSALRVTGYHPNESPPAKLHFYAMQDCFYNENKEYYNISYGGSNNLVRFKELFNPVEIEKPPYYTYVIKKNILALLSIFSANYASRFRNIIRLFDNLFK